MLASDHDDGGWREQGPGPLLGIMAFSWQDLCTGPLGVTHLLYQGRHNTMAVWITD
ncbi:hypothetical protein IF1G_07172 [Cordyceps javanica]|uniref:Uncharacterized protein n=1 Tax=Cordyceps javanica TaxID=43265 RepID=A0A545UXV7_9HYPO|nr:hypothetical protein IF1G_07172 [Cordyceps javanica]